MLKQPFTGKELYCEHEFQMGRFNRGAYEPNSDELTQAEQDAWDIIGKTKKQAWNNLAKLINSRMQAEKSDPSINGNYYA